MAASMRSPEKDLELGGLPRVIRPRLDVLDAAGVEAAVAETTAAFGCIDVLVNNAGYGLIGPFEPATEDQIRRQFETNVLGMMRVIRAVLPSMRQRRRGTIVNVSSMGGRMALPLLSVYHATKWAVEGFSESLRFELEPLGIKVKIVEPGATKTEFGGRSKDTTAGAAHADYKETCDRVFANLRQLGARAADPATAAQAIVRAASDESDTLRYPVGLDARALLPLRKILPDSWYVGLMRRAYFKPL